MINITASDYSVRLEKLREINFPTRAAIVHLHSLNNPSQPKIRASYEQFPSTQLCGE
jgi:uncharacterized Rossmann fold enzyme